MNEMPGPLALVRQAQDGSPEAFGRLVEIHWDRLVRLARSVVGELEAEDVVQDALIVAWQSLPKLVQPDSFGSWITRIVFRRCLKKTRWKRLRLALEDALFPASHPDLDSELTLQQLLARLPPRQRAVLHLTVVEELSDSEVGTTLGIAPGSVRAHRLRARRTLARLVQGEA